jgi:hypothetical protein
VDPSSASNGTGYNFNEVLDEEALSSKVVKINRAPIMMAWSCIVAEKLGFEREEALSIGMLRLLETNILRSFSD